MKEKHHIRRAKRIRRRQERRLVKRAGLPVCIGRLNHKLIDIPDRVVYGLDTGLALSRTIILTWRGEKILARQEEFRYIIPAPRTI